MLISLPLTSVIAQAIFGVVAGFFSSGAFAGAGFDPCFFGGELSMRRSTSSSDGG
jgi:hypothetical protein